MYIIYDDNDDDDNNNDDNDNDERCLKHLANGRLQQGYDDQKIGNFSSILFERFPTTRAHNFWN